MLVDYRKVTLTSDTRPIITMLLTYKILMILGY